MTRPRSSRRRLVASSHHHSRSLPVARILGCGREDFPLRWIKDRRERLSRHRSGNIAVMMVGNKSDLNHLRSVPEEDRQPGIFVRRRKACPSSRHLPLEGGNKRREGVPHHTILSEIHQTLSKKALAAQQSASANGRSMHGTNHH